MDFGGKLETSDNIILASGSPRRIEMMKKHGIDPIVIKPQVEEFLPEQITMQQAVMYLSLKKVLWAEARSESGIIIAADTIVYNGRIIGKPKDYEDAFSILKELKGKKHFVVTGVSILEAHGMKRRSFAEVTEVHVRDYTDAEIEAYIATGEPWDKAGGYAIQGAFGKYIDHCVGDEDNVIGFPWSRIQSELKRMGFGKIQ